MIQNTYYYEYMYYNSYFSATCNFDAKGNIVNGKLNPGDTLTFSGKFNNKNFNYF